MEPKIIRSGRFQFNRYDFEKWWRNTLIFLSPALIVFLTQIKLGVPIKEALGALYVWILGIVLDWLRKFSASNK